MLRRLSRTAGWSACVVLAAAVLAACDVGPVVLEGALTHAETGDPLVGVPVRVYSSSAETVVARARTGEDGTYRIRRGDLADGTYRVEFSVGHWWEDAGTWDTATDLSVSVGSPLRLDAALVPEMTTVWGTTYHGTDLQTGIRVDAFYGGTGELAATTVSDFCGSSPFDEPCFELNLPTGGRYSFRASMSESSTVQWYGGLQGIQLAPGRMEIEPFSIWDESSIVQGRVVDGDGSPLGGVRVLAILVGEPVPPRPFEDTTAGDGTFVVRGFEPNGVPVPFELILVTPDGEGTLVGMVNGDPQTATQFVIPPDATVDVGVIALDGNLTGATAVGLGLAHSCAVVVGGEVRCWGSNAFGQLGDGTTQDRLTPVAVVGLSGVTDIVAGAGHTCAVVADGEVRCWGSNGSGQLGDGTTQDRLTPVAVTGLSGVTDLTAGAGHTCAVLAGGEVRCWGTNGAGQLGDGTTQDRLTPVAVVGLSAVTDIAAGVVHTCAVGVSGEMRCWGNNSTGQLGDGTTQNRLTPVAVVGLSGVTDLATGAGHTCAVVTGGAVRCSGSNDNGQLGDGTTQGRLTPVAVVGLSGVTDIAAGGGHTCAVLATGQVRCWGSNGFGQLGDSTTRFRTRPVAVGGLTSITDIAGGDSHTCAVIASIEVRCWGNNGSGQLGDSTTQWRLTPVAVIDP